MAGPQVYLGEELTAGVRTRPVLDGASPPHLLVENLDWESGFRGSDLQPGDQVLAVNGEPVAGQSSKQLAGWIGQVDESRTWTTQARKEDDAITLTVRRRNPQGGWKTLDVSGKLRLKRSYRDDSNSPTLWFGGPSNYERDGFNDAWPAWAEAMQKRFTWTLCGGWQQRSMVTRYELKSLLEEGARVDLLMKKYPGDFANALKRDYDATVAFVQGTLYPIGDADLAFRRADEERAAEVSALAKAEWEKCRAALAAQIIPAFPAEHPVTGKARDVVGKLVLFERLPTRNWISESGHNWLFAGESDEQGWYFMDAESDAAFRMFRAVRRYMKVVAPNIREEYTVLARILPGAGMLMIGTTAHWGLKAEPVAAIVGDAMFVDLSKVDDKESRFAGEDGLLKPRIEMPGDEASPGDVLTAMIAAIKAGDMTVWKSLFANWRVTQWQDGAPQVHYQSSDLRDGAWEDSRRTLQGRACDARVVWVGDVEALTSGKEFDGAPKIDEVDAEVEHIGVVDPNAATKEYRAFKDVTVNRLWKLQRIDGGPWRIASAQNL